MEEEQLAVRTVSKKKYSSYEGEITPATPHVIRRNFKVERPDEKWLTDITGWNKPSGKVYLSPMIDCFDGAAVSWSISANSELVDSIPNQTLDSLCSFGS